MKGAIKMLESLQREGADAGVVAGRMFGAEALFLGGRAIVCAKREMIGLRLGAGTPAHTDALSRPGAELFDPSGKHRPFRDWVAIPIANLDASSDLLSEAIQYAANDAEPHLGARTVKSPFNGAARSKPV